MLSGFLSNFPIYETIYQDPRPKKASLPNPLCVLCASVVVPLVPIGRAFDMHNFNPKQALRRHYRSLRDQLPPSRRQEAALALCEQISAISTEHQWITSFASFNSEIDTVRLNEKLAQMGKLVLPRVIGQTLIFFHVEQLTQQLKESAWGILEPIPEVCQEIPKDDLSIILVPGLAFDSQNHRLGYGKGFYDAVLFNIPTTTRKMGIGFREQLSPSPLPTSPQDIALDLLLLS